MNISRSVWVLYAATILSFELFFRLVAELCCALLPRPVLDKMNEILGVVTKAFYRLGDSPCLFEASSVQLIQYRGYPVEEHVVQTKDGFILVLHRIPGPRGSPRLSQRPPVFVMHGFLMNSEAWVVPAPDKSIAFLLADAGYDVWLGNSRGNKYSHKHIFLRPNDEKYWDFSIDDMARYDVPACLEYVLDNTRSQTLTYIGFSQGTAQAFACFSTHPHLARRVNLFVALAPATTVNGLHNSMVDALVKSAPEVIFLLMGRKVLLPMSLFWRSVLSRQNFARTIDVSLQFLFGWSTVNIAEEHKQLYYSHLYSTGSVKTVVHWFQIMRSGRFQMYDDMASLAPAPKYRTVQPPSYPLFQLQCPTAVFYGGKDTIPNIKNLLAALPATCFIHEEPTYEHLDFLWAHSAHTVYEKVLSLVHEATSNHHLVE
mmetsp:Transcript_30192/g.48755  ORF Transcript_30192/g.48755 Transcript_30192/m.48755 type:complete len:428 (-) Transcript_30192:201-1484(-)